MEEALLELAGSKSWRMTADVAGLPHIALYIRDALGLGPLESADPPRLEGDVPDRSALIAPDDRVRASATWHTWWAQIISSQTSQLPRQAPPHATSVWLQDAHQPAAPANSPSAADADSAPGLIAVIRELEEEARAWLDLHRRRWRPPPPEVRRQQTLLSRSAAEAAARLSTTPTGELSADTILLLVRGDWSLQPSPGVLMHAPSLFSTPDLMERRLRDTFASSAASTAS